MRKNIRHIAAIIFLTSMIFMMSISVMANEQKAIATSNISSNLFLAETTTDTADQAENTEQEADSSDEDLVSSVNNMIDALNEDDVSKASVEEALEAYNNLSTAQKLQVENYEILEQAAESFELDNDSSGYVSEDSNNQKNGTNYNFRISTYAKQLTLTLRLVVDADGDGNMDVPDITVKSPDNNVYTIGKNDSILSNDECNIEIIRTSNYIQMDVENATNGVWQVETSSRVVFELSEYTGDKQSDSFTPTDGEETQIENDDNVEKGTNPIVLFVFLAFVIVVFVLIKHLPVKDKDGKKKKKTEEIDDGAPRPLTKEEEIAKIRAEWEKSRSQYEDEENLVNEQDSISDDLAQTIEDIDDDEDDLEEFDIGFFSHSRFTKDDDE